MEAAGVIVTVLGCISPHVAKRWEYHRNVKKYLEALRGASRKLNARKTDIQTELDAKIIPGETEKTNEVQSWLECFEEISQEIEDIEKNARHVKFFSRARHGKRFFEIKEKVDEFYAEGAFSDEQLVRSLPQRGLVQPTRTILEGETTSHKTRNEILGCLLDKEIRKIGVYGMGGVGKTTALEYINNFLLNENDKFDKVIFVTASKGSTVMALQGKIASMLKLDFANDDDEKTRAAKLYKKLIESKRYVLILDDLWEEHDLRKVGIPEPTSANGCKLVLTTRSRDVCRQMCCEPIIEMGLLSEEEALNLFYDSVGNTILSNRELEKTVKQVAQECARLPLAIVTVAGSLRDKDDLNYWVTALADLKDATASASTDITKILRLSYDHLKNEKLKDCLLYCALYPEDYSIDRDLLIDQLIAEGIVEENRSHPKERGQAMLNDLVSVCLVIDSTYNNRFKCVKLHDLIRDMAIQIMRESPSKFVVKLGEGPESMSGEENWSEDIEKISLMGMRIVTESPKCPRLSTLFLIQNSELKSIPGNFFRQMEGLHVLNLSDTGIEELPESVSVLVNLAVLLLRHCSYLVHVPDLSELRNMRRLDLFSTGIKEVPRGIEKLVKLTYLNLSETGLRSLPEGILCKLTNLQHLSLFHGFVQLRVSGEELAKLGKLKTLQVSFAELNDLNSYFRSLEEGRLTSYLVTVNYTSEEYFLSYYNYMNSVKLTDCDTTESASAGGFPLALPKYVEELDMKGCRVNVSSLCKLTSIQNITDLRRLHISYCNGLEYVFYCSPAIFPLLQRIEEFDLRDSHDLRGFIGVEIRSSLPQLPPESFSSLKRLNIDRCDNIKKLLVLNNCSLPNLEDMEINCCWQLEEIISTTTDRSTVTLPKLKSLDLQSLPKLKSVPFIADSVLTVRINNCPMLTRIPFLDSEPFHPCIQSIRTNEYIWDSCEWDHPNAKDAANKLVSFVGRKAMNRHDRWLVECRRKYKEEN